MKTPEIRITEDGSLTLYQAELDETFHSMHGALTESRHIFLDLGLKSLDPLPKTLRILELGFGTGLNIMLSLQYAMENDIRIRYQGVELYPLTDSIVEQISTGPGIDAALFHQIHDATWDDEVVIAGQHGLYKDKCDIRDFKGHSGPFDLVYFDAFGPDVQPQLWTPEVFKRIAEFCSPGASLVTYSSKGSVRRALGSAGFSVEKHPGPPGKREIVRARLIH